MLLSVPPRSGLPAFAYNKSGKKQPYVPPAQPLGPPSPSPAGGARTSSARPISTSGGCTPAPRTRTSSSSASR
ncbi:unnamed protein product, partial [Bubo scandiacus]